MRPGGFVFMDLLPILKQHWGYPSFRPLQERIISSIVAGHDVAAVLPTGGGKSLCYQLPAVVMGGTAIVVSPLIALMQDQAAQLSDVGIAAAVVNSTLNPRERSRVMTDALDGRFRLLYLSPERISMEETLGWLGRLPLRFFAVDEAHCISEWGHEFRPDYGQLGVLRDRFPQIPLAAFTASATKRVRHDMLRNLGMRNPHKYITSFRRPNLRYLVKQVTESEQRRIMMSALRAHDGETAIIYCPTVREVMALASSLEQNGFGAVPYHGQMDAEDRRRNQEAWMADEKPIMVGTIAFGLGINKPAVRLVVHTSLPKSLEQYYQEAGRAGRDGQPSDCVMLWQAGDIGLHAFFIKQLEDEEQKKLAWWRLKVMRQFVDSPECRQRQICMHFGETPKWDGCEVCDRCSAAPEYMTAADVKPAKRIVVPPAPSAPLLSKLKSWRREVAAARHVPAYVVMNDATLEAIAAARPSSPGELLEIPGIGPRKAEMYGNDLLRLVTSAG